MRIAVSADDPRGLDSVVSPHFGRCPYFILIDVDGQDVQAVRAVENPFYAQHEPGQVPGFIHSQGANVMLTGGMGGRAVAFFEQYGIEPVTGASGAVHHSLEMYLGGSLRGAEACQESVEHGHGSTHSSSLSGGPYMHDEAGRLREEADALQQQLNEVQERLRRLQGEGTEKGV